LVQRITLLGSKFKIFSIFLDAPTDGNWLVYCPSRDRVEILSFQSISQSKKRNGFVDERIMMKEIFGIV
jgi:hypothetical protein